MVRVLALCTTALREEAVAGPFLAAVGAHALLSVLPRAAALTERLARAPGIARAWLLPLVDKLTDRPVRARCPRLRPAAPL